MGAIMIWKVGQRQLWISAKILTMNGRPFLVSSPCLYCTHKINNTYLDNFVKPCKIYQWNFTDTLKCTSTFPKLILANLIFQVETWFSDLIHCTDLWKQTVTKSEKCAKNVMRINFNKVYALCASDLSLGLINVGLRQLGFAAIW